MKNLGLKTWLLVGTMLSGTAIALPTEESEVIRFDTKTKQTTEEQSSIDWGKARVNFTQLYDDAGTMRYPVNVQLQGDVSSYRSLGPSFSAQISQQRSRWFWEAGASAQSYRHGDIHDSFNYEIDRYNHEFHQYFRFPEGMQSSVPIITGTIENLLNKAVNRRLRKTDEEYERLENYSETMDRINQYRQIAGMYNIMPLFNDELHSAQMDLGFHTHSQFATNAVDGMATLTLFNPSLQDDMDSVLTHFKQTRQGPGIRLRGETGYRSDNVDLRIGAQKQRLRSDFDMFTSQQRDSYYATAQWNIGNHWHYFTFATRETVENSFGFDGFDRELSSEYHRVVYDMNDNTSIYAGLGNAEDTLFGKTDYQHIGARYCNSIAPKLDTCLSLNYEQANYDQAATDVFQTDNRSGFTTFAKLTYKF